ncbi:hypothetical protein RJ641_018390 [Dillenia turbinata]|uniref:Uncharacterized protein n=1 Tax=Dillenia turbinata TaxID=194707 RepID=A0AAN8YWH3_9MAGN
MIVCGAGVGETPSVPAKSTVFINGAAFEVSVEPFNVREACGDDAVLIHSSGQPVYGSLLNPYGVWTGKMAFDELMQLLLGEEKAALY